jgi:polyphosphate kinase
VTDGDARNRSGVAEGYAAYGTDGVTPPAPVTDGDTEGSDGPDEADHGRFLNRELSELAFHRRVLYEAADPSTPLLERVEFLTILTRNLDEFFMKRVGGLKQQIDAGVTQRSPDGRTPHEQWELAAATADEVLTAASDCYEAVHGALVDEGIEVLSYPDLTDGERASLREYFETEVLPTLTPLTFDPAHPFPFISNLSLSLAVRTRQAGEGIKFSRVKIPENRPRLVRLREDWTDRSGDRFVPLERVVEANLDLLFPNVEILDAAAFRVTRNAEVRRNEEVAEGLIETIEGVLRDRRFATVVRLEVEPGAPEPVRELLRDQLDLEDREVFERPSPLDFRDLSRIADLDRPGLKPSAWTPQPHPRLPADTGDRELFATVRRGDVLVHHPYHSFDRTVQWFLDAAARDEDVLAVKLAIYRTARDSQVVESLIRAAKNGKQVAVMVELKARFDEENNLRWVRRLEEEGIHVAYGTIGLKTHAKAALVVREEEDGVELYSHVGTGNYHSETAKGYTDLGVLTADRAVGNDLSRLFNYFTGHSMAESYDRLLVAPETMRERFLDLVRRECAHARAGRPARIVAKLNSLEDPGMVEALYRASAAGVEVDLIVRGICRLRPGIDGLSENVTVRSIVGRFLEHSRVFYFANGSTGGPRGSVRETESPGPAATGDEAVAGADTPDEDAGDPAYLLGSADWMTRNLDRRVEAVVPVADPSLRAELELVLSVLLADDRNAWEMDADGGYTRVPTAADVDAHELLMARAAARTPTGAPWHGHRD